jgi:regulator of sirC expression with transglutaminase-like and TPR domain
VSEARRSMQLSAFLALASHAILRLVSALVELLVRQNEGIPLDVAALQIAMIEYPTLSLEPSLQLLDSMAEEIDRRLPRRANGRDYVQTANEYLFLELGFHGNGEDYYDPLNSCLNEVLIRRSGIPISLSVLYIEVARRLQRPVYGIGLPGHFLAQYADREYATFIDTFHGGTLLSSGDCRELAQRIAGVDVQTQPDLLKPVTKRHILLRMLNNLRAVYLRRQNYPKAVRVLDLLLQAAPNSREEYRQRGVLQLQLRQFRAARHDLAQYLRLAPEAEDRAEIEAHLRQIDKWMATLN